MGVQKNNISVSIRSEFRKKTIFQKLKKQGAANRPTACWLWPPIFSIFERLFFFGTPIGSKQKCCFFCTPNILCFYASIQRGLKDPWKFKSYRAIAGASQLLKLYEYVILKLWGHRLTSDSLQFGFKPNVSTTQCSWLVLEVAQWQVQRGGVCMAAFMDCSMAFDKCLYSKLFTKMLAKNVPLLIVRVLAFAYEEQVGWKRLAGKNSNTFTIKNAIRQGSPYLLSACYLDDLMVELRRQRLGCHVAGVWTGAAAFADDLAVLAPNWTTLQKMVTICEEYGKEHNLVFSMDPIPRKSKTKCVFFSGSKKNS